MRKLLLSFAVLIAVGTTSCGNENTKEKDEESTEKTNLQKNLDEMCECVTEMMAFGDAMMDGDEIEMMQASQKIQEKELECMEIASKIEEGKSNEELEKIKEDFQNNCEALKNM